MKRIIYSAANQKVNKTELRSKFVGIATEIRDLSKFEFVQLLKEGDFDTALSWIDDLQSLLDKFNQQYKDSLGNGVVRVIANGNFVGYIEDIYKGSGSRGWGGRYDIQLTHNIDEAQTFSSEAEIKSRINRDFKDIGVYDHESNVGYRDEHSSVPHEPGTLDELASSINDMDIYYANIEFEFEAL